VIALGSLPAAGFHPEGYGPLVGVHPLMQRVYEEIDRVAATSLPVVITGPTGSGKELVAAALHTGSGRPGPYQALNVHQVTESLAEATLFGAARGAYTGATVARAGLFAAADHGTLLLDEAGDVPVILQAKLLRVIETGRIRRLGTEAETSVDVRLVIATQRAPSELARTGSWRPDFAYRVAGWVIKLPPLAQRASDIPLLARHLLGGRLDPVNWAEVTETLQRHHWPGNVRELQRILGCADLLAKGVELGARQITEAMDRIGLRAPASRMASLNEWNRTLDEVSRDHVRRVLEMTAFDIRAASAILGVGRSTLFRRIREWGLRDFECRVPNRDFSPESRLDGWPSAAPGA
jgi:DNA-binding NtrC family response regulator